MSASANAGPSDPAVQAAKRKLVENERVKSTATALNNSAIAATVASVIGPAASDLYAITTPKSPYWWWFGLAWMILATGLHLTARKTLGDLEP